MRLDTRIKKLEQRARAEAVCPLCGGEGLLVVEMPGQPRTGGTTCPRCGTDRVRTTIRLELVPNREWPSGPSAKAD